MIKSPAVQPQAELSSHFGVYCSSCQKPLDILHVTKKKIRYYGQSNEKAYCKSMTCYHPINLCAFNCSIKINFSSLSPSFHCKSERF